MKRTDWSRTIISMYHRWAPLLPMGKCIQCSAQLKPAKWGPSRWAACWLGRMMVGFSFGLCDCAGGLTYRDPPPYAVLEDKLLGSAVETFQVVKPGDYAGLKLIHSSEGLQLLVEFWFASDDKEFENTQCIVCWFTWSFSLFINIILLRHYGSLGYSNKNYQLMNVWQQFWNSCQN